MRTAGRGGVEVGLDGAGAVAALVVDRDALAAGGVGDEVDEAEGRGRADDHVGEVDRGFDGDPPVARRREEGGGGDEHEDGGKQGPGADEEAGGQVTEVRHAIAVY